MPPSIRRSHNSRPNRRTMHRLHNRAGKEAGLCKGYSEFILRRLIVDSETPQGLARGRKPS